LLLLSARTETAAEAMAERLAAHLAAHPDLHLPAVAYTLAVGRTVFRQRRALVCREASDTPEIADPARWLAAADSQDPRKRPVVFLFPGQGSQHPGMGEDLYRGEPVFRAEIDRSA